LSVASKAAFTTLPRAQFAELNSTAIEGEGTHLIKVIFDKPFHGTLKYRTLPISTASAPADFAALSGALPVDDSVAYLSVSLADDLSVSGSRMLCLEIVTDPAQPYARGGQTRHVITIAENDGWWTGVLQDKFAQRNFRVKILRNGSVQQAVFAAGAGLDGLPILKKETSVAAANQSSQSEGVIPKGTWQGAVPFYAATHFEITSPAMPASTGGLFSAGAGLTRTLDLDCRPSATGSFQFHSIAEGRYIGTYTEVLAFSSGNSLATTNVGTFVLVRDVPPLPQLVNPFTAP
jgi:hypothetical protein